MSVEGKKKRIYINGLTCGQPQQMLKANAGATVFAGAAAGADGTENLVVVDGQVLEYHVVGTHTVFGMGKVATGLRPILDAHDNDGFEISGGILQQNDHVFKVGTDKAFHIAARLNLSANAAFDLIAVGFRNVGAYLKPQAPATGMALYTDIAALCVYDVGTPFTTIHSATEVGDAGFSAVDSTDVIVAATPFEFRVNVSDAGVVTFEQDLAADADPAVVPTLVAPTVTQARTLAADTYVTPIIIGVKGAANAATLDILKLDVGYDVL